MPLAAQTFWNPTKCLHETPFSIEDSGLCIIKSIPTGVQMETVAVL